MGKKSVQKKVTLEAGLASLKNRFGGKLNPPLEGLAYRFTLWLPIQSAGKAVLQAGQLALLFNTFHGCFGGCSHSRVEGFPPWSGAWLPAGASEAVVDHHILVIVYTVQDAGALLCMQQVKWLLQQDFVAQQEVILVEQTPVHLVEAVGL